LVNPEESTLKYNCSEQGCEEDIWTLRDIWDWRILHNEEYGKIILNYLDQNDTARYAVV
jgi:hypothetical protein